MQLAKIRRKSAVRHLEQSAAIKCGQSKLFRILIEYDAGRRRRGGQTLDKRETKRNRGSGVERDMLIIKFNCN